MDKSQGIGDGALHHVQLYKIPSSGDKDKEKSKQQVQGRHT